MNAVIDVERIKDTVTIRDALRVYHDIGRCQGRTYCPFCEGSRKDTFGYNDRTWHCFRCGNKGDVIEFTKQLFNVDFHTAGMKLCEDFRIPTAEKITVEEREIMKAESEKRKKIRAAGLIGKRRNDFNFILACRFLWWLRRQPQSNMVSIYLNDLERWTERMAVGEMEIDYDIKAMLKSMRLKITEERNAVKSGIDGDKIRASSGMDSRGL